jgi:hypothetical protein
MNITTNKRKGTKNDKVKNKKRYYKHNMRGHVANRKLLAHYRRWNPKTSSLGIYLRSLHDVFTKR